MTPLIQAFCPTARWIRDHVGLSRVAIIVVRTYTVACTVEAYCGTTVPEDMG
jgi:hypothetical protein